MTENELLKYLMQTGPIPITGLAVRFDDVS